MTFRSIVKQAYGGDTETSNQILMDIQQNINNKIEEYFEGVEEAGPVVLTPELVGKVMESSGVTPEKAAKIKEGYEEAFIEELPLAENMVDIKELEAQEQIQKERELELQVESLRQQLREARQKIEDLREQLAAGAGWIPCDEDPPTSDKYILLSFENLSIPLVGKYKEDETGGAFYIGNEDETCVSQNVIVNAWQPLPKRYQSKEDKGCDNA